MDIYQFAGWTAYINALATLTSSAALIVFFAIGGIWGRVNDTLSVLWALSLIPLMAVLYLLHDSINPFIALIITLLGIAAALLFAVLQSLLVLGRLRYQQTERPVVLSGSVIGLFLIVMALLAFAGQTLPTGLIWLMLIYGAAYVIIAPIFLFVDRENPIAAIAFFIGTIAATAWAIWFGSWLLSGDAALIGFNGQGGIYG